MKRIYIATAAMLLGTSAIAATSAAQDKFDKTSPLASKFLTVATAGALPVHFASAEKSVAASATAKPLMADSAYFEDPIIQAKHAQAAALKGGMGGPFEAASSETEKPLLADSAYFDDPIIRAKHAQAAALKSSNGVGGPVEVAGSTSLDLTPRPAAGNYPACDPGPGDDRCIQLYEPGVRAQLAAWNRTTGGLGEASASSAMGGPYEPVDGGLNDSAAIAESTDSKDESSELAGHSEFNGVGGPIEAQSGYPPCSPGPGDDRCIQLYEPGVTGAGN
jgi:hypothetical protein